MKRNKFLIKTVLTLVVSFVIASCAPEKNNLGDELDVSEISYDIIQDYTVDPGGNTVIMTNNTLGVTLTWDYGTGRSNKKVETIRYAFKGDYTINVSAVTKGGIVQLDPVTITVTDDNLSYVDDPLWTALSGGVGNSKTWLLDLDADGVSKYFGGPLYFYGTEMGWLEGGDNGCYGTDCWNWNPDWAGNQWLMGAEDFGSMTFSLDGGPFATTTNLSTGTDESGTYFLDKDAYTLSFTDASMLHNIGHHDCVESWTETKIFSLTEDTMQLGVFRKDECEGRVLLVYNFITKEYSDNWVPEDLPDPDPDIDLGDGTLTDLISVTTTKVWSLSPDSPFDWTDLEGNLLNGWQTVEDYEAAGWPAYTSADQAAVASNTIIFSSDGTVKTINSDGIEEEGTYETTTDGTNIITFSDIVPSFQMGGWAVATTTSVNQWKVIKTALTGTEVTDIWFGKRDETGKDEYMVFHFVLGSSASDPIEENRQLIIESLTGGSSRTFKVSDTWHVDWLNPDLSGGWTSATTFGDDYSSNSWVWTEAVRTGLQDPTLTFTDTGSGVTVTKDQDGTITTADVIIDPENNTISIDMDLIAFTDAASWLPTYGATWYICKAPLTAIETDGLWLGDLNDDETEVTAIHYTIAD